MDDEAFVPAEAFPPGEYIKDELDARGWSQADLAEIIGRPAKVVSDVVSGKSSISAEMAHGLGDAFGTSAQVWMNLDTAYRLRQVRPREAVARRARLYAKGPIKEMMRRRFVEPTDDIDLLERRVKAFFNLDRLEDEPALPFAARKSGSYSVATPAEKAWVFRAQALARAVPVARPYSDKCVDDVLARVRRLMLNPEDIPALAEVLGSCGIRLVVVRPLAGVKIDGVTFWLDPSSPVIALSMRYGRIDWFWFTVLHEIDHVRNGEGAIDIQLVGKDAATHSGKPAEEKRADASAENFEIPRAKLADFSARVAPLYSKVRIAGFAATLGIHPGIVVGRLQHEEAISYSHSRDMLVDVRSLVVESTLSDGWGDTPPVTPEDNE